jgi:hypothetical protein
LSRTGRTTGAAVLSMVVDASRDDTINATPPLKLTLQKSSATITKMFHSFRLNLPLASDTRRSAGAGARAIFAVRSTTCVNSALEPHDAVCKAEPGERLSNALIGSAVECAEDRAFTGLGCSAALVQVPRDRLLEHLHYDEPGQLLTDFLADYLLVRECVPYRRVCSAVPTLRSAQRVPNHCCVRSRRNRATRRSLLFAIDPGRS